jgi:hypothetical protein
MLLAPVQVMAATAIGKVLLSKGEVISVSDGGGQKSLTKGAEVFLNDKIQTSDESYLVLKMADDSKLTLRPNSEITLDSFSQDPGNENAAIGFLKGGLRTLTGAIGKKNPENFRVNTPTTTIGIRGTDFIIRLCEEDNATGMCRNQCTVEEQRLSEHIRLAANVRSEETSENAAEECKPIKEIRQGLYVGLYDGNLNVASDSHEIDISAIASARVEQKTPECLTEIPNFLTLDPYLSENPEESLAEFDELLEHEDLYSRIDKLLGRGYSADSIYNHEISKGNAIYSVVNAAVVADPDRETEFRWLADVMLPGFPGSACGCYSFRQERDWNEITYESLDPKTVIEVSRRFFENREHLARFFEGQAHGLFPVAELERLLKESSLWYRVLPVRSHPVPEGVFVSMYENGDEIVVDGNLGAVQSAVARGDELMPVLFHYYWDDTIPIGRYDEELTADDASDILSDLSTEVSPVPNWKVGDFHAWMKIEEVEELVNIPEKDDIDPELWDKIHTDLTVNGFTFPVILTPGEGIANYKLYNSVERVSVARELGELRVPVVLMEPPRRPNQISRCQQLVRDVEDGGFGVFRTSSGGAGGPPLNDPPPPPPPPVVPPPPVTP